MSGPRRAVAARLAALPAALLLVAAPPAAAQQPTTVTPAAGWRALPAAALRDSARARLARLDGTVALAGLDSAVEVRRDRWGVPHIYARTQHDLFFAQGYVAAQDRLFQMELWRRTGEGRLAEVLGPAHVERDRFARLFRYRGDMSQEWTSYAPDAREIAAAFVAGVNAYIAEVGDRPPIEFALLGFAPEPWTPEVPLNRMAALAMTDNARREVLRAQLVRLLGRERAEAIWPTDPRRRLDPAPGLDLAGIDSLALGAAWAAYRGVSFERVEGSNNWVVSGTKTATGRPLLANDPHRTLSVPSLRYLTHLVAPGWDVIGAGEPAVPGVAAGHNDRVAFGFTIVGMDQQDLYVEDVRPCDAAAARRYGVAVGTRCYVHRGEARPFETVTDTIRVRGEAPRAVELNFTVHGPVVAEDTARRRAFALRFVGAEPGTAGYMASLSLNRARDWASFREAAARWKLPTENLVYADVDGNIGWVAAGLMPVRRWSGLLPVPGNGRFEWTGFVPAAELPMTFNPPEGFIATANHNILPPGYPRPLNYDWAEPYRAERIAEVLRRGGGFTRADFERLQHDELSLPARTLVPPLLAAAKRRGVATPEVAALGRWDHVMRRDEAAPAVFAVWLSHLARRVTARMAPAADSATGAEVRIDLGVLVRQMSRPDSLLGAAPAAARDSLALLSLDDAARDLASRLGPDRAAWRWGALHVAPFAHPVAAAFDLPAAPRGGDANTVNATGGAGFRQTSGASFREILDLADWDNSVVTSTPGQSGQPGSPHYDDLLALWREGRYFPLVYSRPRVEQETAHVLRLEPAR